MSDDVTYKLREGMTRFAAEGHGIEIKAGELFKTADSELCKWLDMQGHAVERADAPAKAGGSE